MPELHTLTEHRPRFEYSVGQMNILNIISNIGHSLDRELLHRMQQTISKMHLDNQDTCGRNLDTIAAYVDTILITAIAQAMTVAGRIARKSPDPPPQHNRHVQNQHMVSSMGRTVNKCKESLKEVLHMCRRGYYHEISVDIHHKKKAMERINECASHKYNIVLSKPQHNSTLTSETPNAH